MMMRIINLILSILTVLLFSSVTIADTVQNGAAICWSLETFELYLKSDVETKKHMEDHECGILQIDMETRKLKIDKIILDDRIYKVARIELIFESYGKKHVDKVWTLLENIK